METTITLPVKQQFKNIIRKAKSTYAKANTNDYYRHADILTEMLRKFLHNDISDLSKNDLLILCDLVNRHRPVALHSFLITLSQLAKNAPKL